MSRAQNDSGTGRGERETPGASPDQKTLLARLQTVFNSIPDAIVLTDTDRRIVMVNPAVEKIFGYSAEEVIGQPTLNFYGFREDHEEQGRIRYNLDAEEHSEPYRVAYRRKNNEVFLSETVGTVIRDEQGKIIGYVALIRDITEQKRKEDKLRQTELNYRTIAQFTYDWEYWINPDNTFRYVSPSCERITAYTLEEFVENPRLLEEIVVPEDRGLWRRHVTESDRDPAMREIQFRIRRKDGDIRWIEHACQPVLGENNRYFGYRASNRDITKRKESEIELQKAFDEIAQLKEKLEAERSYLREEINLDHNFHNIIGNSNALQYVLYKVEQVATSDTSVLVLGETGTGKELIARAIHDLSDRRDRPLVKVNCAALPVNLIENELFGHEKGAFTGADKKRIGRFELADGATIFLDEVGEIPLEVQVKLLRVLQDGEFERIGSSRTIKVDVRVIAATNRDLEEDAKQGRFRQDLLYRLNVFPITVPPLRDRVDDIPLLVSHFIEKFARQKGKTITSIPAYVIRQLKEYQWPGNIRELENVLERAVINSANAKLKLADKLFADPRVKSREYRPLHEMEREYILEVLEKVNWKVSGKNSAAEILQIDRSTLRGRMKKLGISKSPR